MTRWALLLEYDGAGFVGWQRQAVGISFQAVLEDAAAHLAGAPVGSIVAGRTDAGVHAFGQVAHIDLAREITAERLVQALNFHMKPHRVSVLRAASVPPDWNARFSATARAYRYVILNRRARPALDAGRVWHLPQALDSNAMAEGAAHLLGRHDFSSFRAASCQAASPLRTLDRLDVRREGDRVLIEAGARSFLHHQVRNMVGTLKLVGEGRWPPEKMAQVLAAASRQAAGETAPPEGLFLTAVTYSDGIFACGAPDARVPKPRER
jgi:tRNA pseudouridine38-40 synthase